jgi:hypothetical protein
MPRRLAASTDSLNALGRDDHDDGALSGESGEGLLDTCFAFGVEGAGCFIE